MKNNSNNIHETQQLQQLRTPKQQIAKAAQQSHQQQLQMQQNKSPGLMNQPPGTRAQNKMHYFLPKGPSVGTLMGTFDEEEDKSAPQNQNYKENDTSHFVPELQLVAQKKSNNSQASDKHDKVQMLTQQQISLNSGKNTSQSRRKKSGQIESVPVDYSSAEGPETGSISHDGFRLGNADPLTSHSQRAHNSKRERKQTMGVLQKKAQKVIKVKWVNEDENAELRNEMRNQMLLRPVLRPGQHYTQVNLKLKGSTSNKSSQGGAQSLSAVGERPNMFQKQAGGQSNHQQPQTLHPRRPRTNNTLGDHEARRQAAEVYHPQNAEGVTTFTDNFISAMDQIPGNSQEMSKSPQQTPPSVTISRRQASSVQDGVLVSGTKPQHRQKSQTPALGFRSSNSFQFYPEEQELSSRVIHLEKGQFPMMPLLPPSTAMSGTGVGQPTPSISEDQDRLKLESRIQRLRNQQITPQPSTQNFILQETPEIINLDQSYFQRENMYVQKEQMLGQFIMQTAKQAQELQKSQVNMERNQHDLISASASVDNQRNFTVILQDSEEQNAQAGYVPMKDIITHANKTATTELVQRAQMQSDSFKDESCSPLEMPASQNVSAVGNVTQQEIGQQAAIPLVFNDLTRATYEMLIGDMQRRQVVQENQKVRRSQQVGNSSVKPNKSHVQRLQHHRNHSELLSAQFKKDLLSGGSDAEIDEHTNDKFNVDGNDVGNITSSDDDQGGDQRQSNLDNKYEETDPCDFQVDRNPGQAQHLQHQIGKHSTGDRSMPSQSQKSNLQRSQDYVMRQNRSSKVISSKDQHLGGAPENRNRDRTPDQRFQERNKLIPQVTPQNYFKNTRPIEDHDDSISKDYILSAQRIRVAPIGIQDEGTNSNRDQNDFQVSPGEPLVDENTDETGTGEPMPHQPKLHQSMSTGSRLVPATMTKRQKQTSGHQLSSKMNQRQPGQAPSKIDSHEGYLAQKQLSPTNFCSLDNQTQKSPDGASQKMSSISVKNIGVENGKAVEKDQKQQIKMFNANNRANHFSDSKVLLRLSLPSNMAESANAQNYTENILSSDRMALNIRDEPNETEMMLKSIKVENIKPTLPKATQNNTDNKESRFTRTIQQDGSKFKMFNQHQHQNHQQFAFEAKSMVMSPVATAPRLNTFRDVEGTMGPQPMDSFSELASQQRRSIDQPASWMVQPPMTPATPGIEAQSTGYLMSSLGQVGEDPSGVCMYEMREFMNEPGASKQIASDASRRYQQQMQQQRRLRANNPQKLEELQQDDSHDYDECDEDEGASAIKKTKENTGQKHARKRQKSLETSMSAFRASQIGGLENQQQTLPADFKVIENDQTGEVKLKILRKDAMYVPREVLQDASIFRQVTVLDISNCRIVELEGRIFMQLKNLNKLFAARNQIKYLSGRISECQQLTHINLDCNLLEMIPSEIGQLKYSLIVLKLAQNKLKQLTFSTRELEKLEILNISDNSLTELPDGMDALTSLKELHLSGNSLIRFNILLGRIPKLMKLSLDWFTFLIPSLPTLITRTSHFDIDQELQNKNNNNFPSNRTANNPSYRAIPASKPMIFAPQRQQQQDSHMSYMQRGDQSVVTPKALQSNGKLKKKDFPLETPVVDDQNGIQSTVEINPLESIVSRQTIMSDDGDHLQSIASERNDQKNVVVVGNPSYAAQKIINSYSNPDQLDVFKELAILVEDQCGRSPKKNQNLSRLSKGLEFYKFAEHFTTKSHGGRLPKDWISAQDAKGRTMLHYAAQKGDLNVIQALIQAGADKTKIDQYQFNPYGLALREEHFTAAMYLLRMPNFVYFDIYKGAGTFGSLLHLAVTKLQAEQVRVILQHEVSPNLKDEISAEGPLHILMNLYHKDSENAFQILKSLSDFGVDYNSYNRDNWTPFHVAVKRGNIEAVRAMLEVAGNKTQKSWLAEKIQSSDYVDIDAVGGPNKVTATHIATESNFYDIVDLLFQYKVDIFKQNEYGNTAFTGITNNLLMIKLLKKEQKAFFNENFKPKVAPKEMHITNDIFVQQAFRTQKHEDPILAQHMAGKYRSLKETLKCVNSQLKVPLRTNKQAAFKQLEKEQDITTEEDQIDTIEAVPAQQSNLAIKAALQQRKNPDHEPKVCEATSDCFSIASGDLDENKSENNKNDVSRRSASPNPGSLTQLGQKHFQTQNRPKHKRQGAVPESQFQDYQLKSRQVANLQNIVKFTNSNRTNSPSQINLSKQNNHFRTDADSQTPQLQTPQDNSDTQHTVILNNMMFQPSESPRFLQQTNNNSPPYIFNHAPNNSFQNYDSNDVTVQAVDLSSNRYEAIMEPSTNQAIVNKNIQIEESKKTSLFSVLLKSQINRPLEQSRYKQTEEEREERESQFPSLESTYRAQEGLTSVEDNNDHTVEVDVLDSTLEAQGSSQNEVVTFRQQEKTKIRTSHSKVEMRQSHIRTASKAEERQTHNDIHAGDSQNILQSVTSPPKRQASVKALSKRQLIGDEPYGVDDSDGGVRLAFNASKNLFGDGYEKLAKTTTVNTEQSQGYGSRFVEKTKFYQNFQDPSARKTVGGRYQNPGSVSKTSQQLREAKTNAIFSQSMKQKPRMAVERRGNGNIAVNNSTKAAPNQQKQQLMLIAPQNILYNDEDSSYQYNVSGKTVTKGQKGALKLVSKSKSSILQNVISPTAVVDDDLADSGIEMPAYQPTFKMTKVISESAYSSHGDRLNSVNSRSSTGTQQRKLGLDQLLMRQTPSHPNNSQKILSTRKVISSNNLNQNTEQESSQQSMSNKLNVARSHSHNKKKTYNLLSRESQAMTSNNYTQPQLTVPQKPRLQGKKLITSGEGPKPFFYKYLPNYPLQSDSAGGSVSNQGQLTGSNIPTKPATQSLMMKFKNMSPRNYSNNNSSQQKRRHVVPTKERPQIDSKIFFS